MSVEPQEALAPGPRSHEVAGVLAELRADAPAAHRRLFARYGDVVRLQAGPFITHFMFHPDDVKHVLQDAHKRYSKLTYGGRRARTLLGDGLFMAEGQRWERQRRLTREAFVSRDHPRLLELTHAATLQVLQRWRELAARAESMNTDEELSNLTFLVIGRVLMNGELDAVQAAALRRPFEIAACEAPRLEHLGASGVVDRDPAAEEFRQSLGLVHEIVLEFVARRRAEPGEQDILSRLIEAGADESSGFDDAELRDQIKTLFYAGHETTARSAAFALLAASQRPEVARRLHEDAKGLEGEGSLLERLAGLRYTDAFVKEVLRLCPPLWSLERRALVDDSVRGYSIPESSSVVLSLVVTHEHPEFWDDPGEFRPERFLSDDCPRHRLAYFPFGGGARLCVGNHMATLQLKLMLAMMYRELRFELAPGFVPEITPDLLYRFKAGLHMRPLGW